MTEQQKKEHIRRKKVMRDAGIRVPNMDNSWGPWWEQQWQNAITHKKTNKYYGVPSFTNFIDRTWDWITGNTTYQAEPAPIHGTLKATDMSIGAQVGRTLRNWKYFGDPIRDVAFFAMSGPSKAATTTGTVIKAAPKIIKAVPKIIRATPKVVSKLATKEGAKTALKSGVKSGAKFVAKVAKEAPKVVTSYLGGYRVDQATRAATGKSWGEWAADKMSGIAGFHIEPIVGDLTNPGYYGGYYFGDYAMKGAMKGAEQAVMNQNYSIPFLTNNKTLREGFGKALNVFGLGTGNQNIRYRNGIRDYLGNVVSKYSTKAPKPTVFLGNQLELARQRVLNNLEKYGIKDTDYVSWTTSVNDPSLIQLSKSAGFEIPSLNGLGPFANPQVTVTMPARTYLEHIAPVQGVEASFRPSTATLFHQNTGYIGDIQKLYPGFADAHEFSHAIDWVLQNKTHTTPRISGIDVRLDNSNIKNLYSFKKPKIDLSKPYKADVKVPGLNYNRLKQDISTQEYHHSPTELKARYEQIKNWLGIADERPLTLSEWNQAKRYYTSSVGDNNMQEFFKLVEKPEEFINWASKRYSTNYGGEVTGVQITQLARHETPTYNSSFYPYKVSHDDELPGFLDMIQEQAGGKAPISETTGLTSYAMRKPDHQMTPSERPNIFNGLKTIFRRQDPETITAGDQAYGLAHNLPGWERQTYRGILKDTRRPGFDYEEAARSLMYDVKAQLYKKLATQKGGPLTSGEFEDALWDLKISDFQNAFQRAHGGMYRRDIPLTFDIGHLDPQKDIPKIIEILTKYKNGGKFYRKGN